MSAGGTAPADSLAQSLQVLGDELRKAPVEFREALAVNLAGWARQGGEGPWAGLLLLVFAMPRPKARPHNKTRSKLRPGLPTGWRVIEGQRAS